MRYLKTYKLFESILTKRELVTKIKYLSNYTHNYMKDVNKFTSSNLNFSFSYDTELEIIQIFEAANELSEESPDGFITSVANEFIAWGDSRLIHINPRYTFKFDEEYENYDDEYKKNNSRELYDQRVRNSLHVYVGKTIEKMISGTIWDIPSEDKLITEEDINFINDCLESDYDTHYENENIKIVNRSGNKRGLIIKIPKITGSNNFRISITNDSDFMYRLQSYFNGAIIITGYYDYYKIYLPFYKIQDK